MSGVSRGPGWWQAADLKWYPPELHADYVAPLPPPPKLPPPPRNLPPPPKLPPPPRGDVAQASRQAAGTHNPVPAAPAMPAWDNVRRFVSGLSDPRQGGDNRGSQGGYQPPSSHGRPQGGYGPPAAPQGHDPYSRARGSLSTFDLQKILPGGLIALVGGLLYVVVSFFPWYTINICSASMCGNEMSVTKNAWDRGPATFSVLLFLLVAGIFLVTALQVIPAPKVPLELIALGAVVLGDIFFLVSLISVPPAITGLSRGWGLWVALVLVVGINVGAVLQFNKGRARPAM